MPEKTEYIRIMVA